ncbi:MAG: lamin tail domain-containing protein [Turneriella sp.]|nr:lamin tail domain-containing protein [Turneriella sp.]
MSGLGRIILLTCVAAVFSCRSNPFGATDKSIEEFTVYTSDFTAQTDGGAKAALLEVIAGAKATLNCAFSALTLTDVTNALIAKAGGGVQVKVAFDADVKSTDAGSIALQANSAFTVVSAPIDTKQSQLLYGNGGTAYMRHNFCLADERYIYISTSAPDDTQMRKIPAVALKIGSPQFGIARDFLREANMFSQLLFGNGKAKTDFTTKFTALDQVIGAYWGPQEKPLDILATNLSEATATVDFYSSGFQTTNSSKTDLDVPQTLLRLESAKGLTLRKYFSTPALFDSASKAYTLLNPSQYVNATTPASANIFVVDRGLSSAKTFVYTGALRSQSNSSDDGVLLELRGKRVAETMAAYLDKIGAASTVVSNVGDTANQYDVVISEMHWMGSYNNNLSSDSTDEFVEFYNNTSSAINMSGWKFACTTNGGTTVNSYLTLPSGALIGPGGYFVVATKSTGAFTTANFYTSSLSITNNSTECRLTNGKATPASAYSGQAGFTGNLIDTAGSAAFDSQASMGTNDGTNKIRRSTERIDTSAVGNNTTNWRANVYTSTDNTGVAAAYRDQTFASPGQSGVVTTTVAAGDVVINEIMWMGSYDNAGAVNDSNDEFIELYNKTGSTIALGNWTISGTGISTITLPGAATIAANGYYVIARNASGAFPSANYYKSTTLSISNTSFQLELRTPGNTLIDTANSGAPFAGVNDTTNKIKKSMERRTTGTNGTLVASWYTCTAAGANVAAGYNTKTIATPGAVNSTPIFSVTGATTPSATQVAVNFSEAPTAGTGGTGSENLSNYAIPGLTISGAVLSGSTVTLTTTAQTAGSAYTLTVSNVTSAAGAAALTGNTANFSGFELPKVKSVTPVNATTVDVNFQKNMDAATIDTITGSFVFNNGLSASAVTLQTGAPNAGKRVRITTGAQTPGTSYTLTVSNSVQDTGAFGVDGTANTGTFFGFSSVFGIMDATTASLDGTGAWTNQGTGGTPLALAGTAFEGTNALTWASLTTTCSNTAGSDRHALSSGYFPITPGATYTGSLYVKGGATVGGTVGGRMRIFWYQDNTGTASATASTLDATPLTDVGAASAWTQRSKSFTAPADAYYIRYKFCGYRTGGAAGDQLYLDQAYFGP